jgi:hypothetical protein
VLKTLLKNAVPDLGVETEKRGLNAALKRFERGTLKSSSKFGVLKTLLKNAVLFPGC